MLDHARQEQVRFSNILDISYMRSRESDNIRCVGSGRRRAGRTVSRSPGALVAGFGQIEGFVRTGGPRSV